MRGSERDLSDPQTSGLTRRELLKRGAALGGALVWATPVVQMIGMSPALASHVSDLCICIKLSECSNDATFGTLGRPDNPGNCASGFDSFPVNCDTEPSLGPSFIVGDCAQALPDTFCLEFNGDGTATISFPGYCTLLYVAEKAAGNCFELSPPAPGDSSGSFNFPVTSDCSHIEFCFQC